MFFEAIFFNGDLSSWDVSSVTQMNDSEYDAAMLVSVCVFMGGLRKLPRVNWSRR